MTRTDEELKIIYSGAPIDTLSVMFDMPPREVKRRLADKVAPVKVEAKNPRYRVRDAAPYLCNVVFDPEQFLKNLTPAKLPPQLSKAFWSGMNARQDYEERRGDLWKTTRVIEVLGEVFKTIDTTAKMFVDSVEQRTELTPEQRATIIDLTEGLRASAYTNLVAAFKDYRPADDEHGTPVDASIVVDRAHGDDVTDENGEFDDGFDD